MKRAPRSARDVLDRATAERVLASTGPIVVALSGGGDSTALLHLLAEQAGSARLCAAVVDHGLREGSAVDAQRALGFASRLGVAGAVLTLSGLKPAQASAREARYHALCAYARGQGANVIAAAHTRDDQAETLFMRGVAGSGSRGLAGMSAFAPAPIWPEGRGLNLARPLLGVRRTDLRAYLSACGAEWIEDPANANPAFERVRVRQRLAELEQGGFDVARLAALAERFAAHTASIDVEARDLVRRSVRFEADAVLIEHAVWAGPVVVRQRALAVLLLAAGAAAREPNAAQIETLEARLGAPGFKSATLGGAVVRRAGACVLMTRDTGALSGRADGAAPLPPLPLPTGIETIWDGRAAFCTSDPGWSVVVEDGAPVLARGAERAPLAAAKPVWLLGERVWREFRAEQATAANLNAY